MEPCLRWKDLCLRQGLNPGLLDQYSANCNQCFKNPRKQYNGQGCKEKVTKLFVENGSEQNHLIKTG